MTDRYIQNGETLSESPWDFAQASGSKMRGKDLRPSMNPVFAGHAREGVPMSCCAVWMRARSIASRIEANSLSSNGCEGKIAATPLEILPMVRIGPRHHHELERTVHPVPRHSDRPRRSQLSGGTTAFGVMSRRCSQSASRRIPLHLGMSRQIWPSLYVFTPPQCPASASMRQAAGVTEGE